MAKSLDKARNNARQRDWYSRNKENIARKRREPREKEYAGSGDDPGREGRLKKIAKRIAADMRMLGRKAIWGD